ncbi:MAG: CHAT domain-containing protein, partial [Leptolyngbya sp. SIO1D8]|nr:CHAT domain-containing protein [Leptolyngbya sp. SIO1D8]
VVAVSSEAQYSFQKSIEPIYRELATLLLEEGNEGTSADNLKQAREVIELLRLAELDNFFREACLSAATVEIDQLDTCAAVLYPILLPERLDVVVSLPNQEFQHFSVALEAEELAQTLQDLKDALETPQSDITRTGIDIEFTSDQLQVLPFAEQVYDWLIRPSEAALVAADTQTLVFVLDGRLRSILMSVLYDGNQFLIEKYASALTPGLRLLDPKPLPKQELSVIVAGLSEVGISPEASRFPALPNVMEEVRTIAQYFPSTVLLNQSFSLDNFATQIGNLASPIVHLATHGQFSADLNKTFVLTWDDSLTADRFSNLLFASELSRAAPIELLVLSACETATGDDLAVLGLAGIAMRSGARSTLASLWQVSDPATAQLMGDFYRQLSTPEITKAEAIRQAQLTLLKDPAYNHPYYWSPFVLVGNWL